ncbi:PROTEIN KINESIN LIGHT CHAIN-RELATED 3 [Salix purpurea]|uniref:PROTEIN KINESIN LIGHT CHAIN-RELATED 3 n=1 Tax=Salix purpurea TaxID=77065 RepID=A0A9Q0VT52_SALPP|nr:PROTEIN KINESIN LIGHT CHAIN-RELATED 3 [Salix purpurea]
MHSSDPSPSRASFLSSGEESRMDSELCHLAGDTAEMEIIEEVTISENTLDKKMRKPKAVFAWKKQRRSASALAKFQIKIDQNLPQTAGVDNPYPGPFLLRLTRDMVSSGENPQKSPELALRATKSFEAIPYLERSIEIPLMEDGQNHALAKISGCMKLGGTYAMLGQIENSILCYTAGLEIQRKVLGETDPQVGETCRYVAEAHVQALQFDEAENLYQIALDINREKVVQLPHLKKPKTEVSWALSVMQKEIMNLLLSIMFQQAWPWQEIMNRKCSTKQEAFWRRNMDPLILTALGRYALCSSFLNSITSYHKY